MSSFSKNRYYFVEHTITLFFIHEMWAGSENLLNDLYYLIWIGFCHGLAYYALALRRRR